MLQVPIATRVTHIVRGADDVKDSIDQVESPIVMPQGGSENSATGGRSAKIQLRWTIERMSDVLPLNAIHTELIFAVTTRYKMDNMKNIGLQVR